MQTSVAEAMKSPGEYFKERLISVSEEVNELSRRDGRGIPIPN